MSRAWEEKVRNLYALPREIAAQRGLVRRSSLFRRFGRRANVSTTEVDIWTGADAVRDSVTTAVQLDIVYTPASDGDGTTGARTVVIVGLDANFDTQTETVTLGSSGTDTTVGSYLFVQRAFVGTVGTMARSYTGPGAFNTADISIRATGTGDELAFIEANVSITQQTHYVVPRGYTAYLIDYAVSAEASKPMDLRLLSRDVSDLSGPTYPAVREGSRIIGVEQSQVSGSLNGYVSFPEKTMLWGAAKASSATSGSVEAEYELWLVQDDD